MLKVRSRVERGARRPEPDRGAPAPRDPKGEAPTELEPQVKRAALGAVVTTAILLSSCAAPHRQPGAAQSTSTTQLNSAVAATTEPSPPTTVAATSPPVPTVPQGTSAVIHGCRNGDPLANVYHSYRLQVKIPCLSVSGTVAAIRNESDGDIHVNIALAANEAHLLDQANYAHEHGQLVTEIIPADQPDCNPGQPPRPAEGTYNYGTCTGAHIVTPPLGAHVTVTGPYVRDSDHSWMEIHPVWAIAIG